MMRAMGLLCEVTSMISPCWALAVTSTVTVVEPLSGIFALLIVATSIAVLATPVVANLRLAKSLLRQLAEEAGGLAVAVASDEANNGAGRFDEWKRQRLLGVGADLVIPDFRDAEPLLKTIFNE